MLLRSAIPPRWRSRGVGNSNSLDLTGKKHRAEARLIKKYSLRSSIFLMMGVSLPTPIPPLGYLINKNGRDRMGEAVQAGMPMTVTKMDRVTDSVALFPPILIFVPKYPRRRHFYSFTAIIIVPLTLDRRLNDHICT